VNRPARDCNATAAPQYAGTMAGTSSSARGPLARLADWWRGGAAPREAEALYAAVVARGRAEHWYTAGGVPDTVDGRFDMIAAVLSVVLLRLESDAQGAAAGVQLTERFIDDMDGQLREIGIGDIVVGKHVGRMMSMLGGRLGAYREGLAAGDLRPALLRNLYRAGAPADAEVAHTDAGLRGFAAALAGVPLTRMMAGDLP
jgi:cytochrome b pre-mRNA-processing protein 3